MIDIFPIIIVIIIVCGSLIAILIFIDAYKKAIIIAEKPYQEACNEFGMYYDCSSLEPCCCEKTEGEFTTCYDLTTYNEEWKLSKRGNK